MRLADKNLPLWVGFLFFYEGREKSPRKGFAKIPQ